jgi:hypothetical protein
MPEHKVLRDAVAWLQDIALFLTLTKPLLLTIADSVLSVIGILWIVWMLVIRAH